MRALYSRLACFLLGHRKPYRVLTGYYFSADGPVYFLRCPRCDSPTQSTP